MKPELLKPSTMPFATACLSASLPYRNMPKSMSCDGACQNAGLGGGRAVRTGMTRPSLLMPADTASAVDWTVIVGGVDGYSSGGAGSSAESIGGSVVDVPVSYLTREA